MDFSKRIRLGLTVYPQVGLSHSFPSLHFLITRIVSQCPIAPNGTFTYQFRADVYGTSWYHSHYSAQYADGVFGPMIIYGPAHAKYDYDLGPVIVLSDYNEWD